MNKKKILVFPCGSEVGLEINRALRYSIHFELIGGNSVDDHGKYVFENYYGKFPFVTDDNFIEYMVNFVKEKNIDAIYPAMDKALTKLKENENRIGCKIISSPLNILKICLSKTDTYSILKNEIRVPKIYEEISDINKYPIFIKPNIGYGSRGAKKIKSYEQAKNHINSIDNPVIMEYIPGKEYTVDCFTNNNGELLYVGPRIRNRIRIGISVNTKIINDSNNEFYNFAKKINDNLNLRGAWFFQVKRNNKGDLVLLEVASRIAGSSALHRGRGVNLPLLTLFDFFDEDVSVFFNDYDIEIDRAFNVLYKINIVFDYVYIDFDDCLIIDDKINTSLISFIYEMLNMDKEVILITKHDGNINKTLSDLRIKSIFDKIIHINKSEEKYNFINNKNSIFIDDSFAERKKVYNNRSIPVFSPDMIPKLHFKR